MIAHPIERARDALRFFRDYTASLPDELTVVAGLIHAPDGSGAKLAGMVTCHCGSLAAGEQAMRPLKAFGPPVLDVLGPMPYCQLNAMLDDGYPKGALNYWKSSFLAQLSDDAIDIMVEKLCSVPRSNVQADHRALAWRGNPGRGRRHGLSSAHRGLQFSRARPMGGAGDLRPVHRLGAANLCGYGAVFCLRPLCQLSRRG